MPANDETATFALKVDADAEPAKEMAESLEKFRAAIERSQTNIANYRKSLSLLRGSSDEVKDAKAKLKAALEAERVSLTHNNLAILKLGGSYDKLSKAHKKANDVFASGKKAVSAIGGPARDLTDRLESLKSIMAGATSAEALMALGAFAAVAALAALAVGAVALVSKFTEWLIVSGDMNRNLQLTREAFSGSEKSADAWGNQIDWLRLHTSLTNKELNELSNETSKAFRNTRISGQGMVDVWKAVALAKGAGRDDTASKIMAIVDRAKTTGRGGIQQTGAGIDELQGTGLSRQKVALQLSKDLGVSYEKANIALYQGLVTSDALAKALKGASQVQFGALNEAKMRSLDGLSSELADNVSNWTQALSKADGPLAPLLNDLKSLVDLTGLQSEGGQKAKSAITAYATELSGMLHRNLPQLKELVKKGIDLGVAIVDATVAVVKFTTSEKGLSIIKTAIAGITVAVGALAGAMAPLAISTAIAFAPIILAGLIGAELYAIVDGLRKIDWDFLGQAIVKGLESAWAAVKGAAARMGESIKDGFKEALGIHSPSRVFAQYGRMTAVGYAQGIDRSASAVQRATSSMGDSAVRGVTSDSPEPAGGLASPGASGAPISLSIKVEFNISGSGAKETAAVLQTGSVLDGITHAIQTALRSAGIPTGAAVVAGG